jgi:hypothetical protein
MAHVNDFLCDDCGRWCSTVTIDGKPVPLVVYVVAGVSPDYAGAPVGLNDPGVKVPAFIRELMARPVPRQEWCVECFAKRFGVPLEAAPEPPG